MPYDERIFCSSIYVPLISWPCLFFYADYWPSTARVCGFWFLPMEWQFSCKKCCESSALVSSGHLQRRDELCSAHLVLQTFLKSMPTPPIFVGLSSVGRQVAHFVSYWISCYLPEVLVNLS